jgi:hypothetical protein
MPYTQRADCWAGFVSASAELELVLRKLEYCQVRSPDGESVAKTSAQSCLRSITSPDEDEDLVPFSYECVLADVMHRFEWGYFIGSAAWPDRNCVCSLL